MTVISHPAMKNHLVTARGVLRARRGTYDAKAETDAINMLRWHGDFIDGMMADQFDRSRQMESKVPPDRDEQLIDATLGLALAITVISAAFAIAGIALAYVAG